MNLDIVTPLFIFTILFNIFFDRRVPVCVNEALEVATLEVDVVHGLLPHLLVILGVAIQLHGKCSIQAVAIVLHHTDLKILLSLQPLLEFLLLLLLLNLLELLTLKS